MIRLQKKNRRPLPSVREVSAAATQGERMLVFSMWENMRALRFPGQPRDFDARVRVSAPANAEDPLNVAGNGRCHGAFWHRGDRRHRRPKSDSGHPELSIA